MKRPVATLLFWALCASSAHAQNPVIEHYRAYQTALEHDDLANAEIAAAAALEASEARDGDGGSTAALALNLATVRFLRGDAAGALAPAQRAAALAAAQGEASRVSPVFAQLVLGRTQIALGDESGAPRVLEALTQAQAMRLSPMEIYDAAVDLGYFSFTRTDFAQSREAWSIAANYAEGSRFPTAYALARARVGVAAADVMDDLTRTGLRRGELSEEGAGLAWRELTEAVTLLQPLAEVESASGEMTLAQVAYAEALAWRAVLRAKILTDDIDLPDDVEARGDGAYEIDVPVAAPQPRCLVRFSYAGALSALYPTSALNDGALAGVAVRYRVNEAGEVTEARTVAIIGREAFARTTPRSVGA
jgi:hypothetical protein